VYFRQNMRMTGQVLVTCTLLASDQILFYFSVKLLEVY